MQKNKVTSQLAPAASTSPLQATDTLLLNMEAPAPIIFSPYNTAVQRKCADCEEEEKFQRKESGGETPFVAPQSIHNVLNSGGRSMETDTRSFMESRFNYDFNSVKIHNNDLAAKSADSINALAYTSGNNIVFNSGQYNPDSDSGKRLLAHELTHVVQQEKKIGRSTVQRNPKAPLPMDEPAKVKPADTCLTLISLDANVKSDSAVSDACKGYCRMELGCCTTERGKCGSSPGSGSIIKAEVEAPKDCAGELGFMQNVMSTDRKRTFEDKTNECMTVSETRADGGVPYKGCKLEISAPGKYSIETDDCPNIRLDDKMISASANDSFKTFLIWKAKGSPSWKPIANVSWNWIASTSRIKGADCASNWSKPAGKSSGGAGKSSGEIPDRSADIKDEKWSKCVKQG